MFEAAFVGWLVALFGDRFVRGTGRLLLGSPEERRLRQALTETTKVAISGLLLDVPDQARDALGDALRERFSIAPVTLLDGHTRVRDALVGAIQEQIAPLQDPRNTTTGTSFLAGIAVDGSRLADDLAAIAIRSIQQLGPAYPALAPLAAQLNADSAEGRDEALADKVDGILAKLEKLTQSRSAHAQRQFAADALDAIVDAVLETQSFRDDSSRSEVLFSLPEPLRSAVPRSPRPRVQAYQLVQTCGSYPHGLRDLVKVLRSFERNSLEMQHLDSVVMEMGPVPEGGS